MIQEDQGKTRSDVTPIVPIGTISTDRRVFFHLKTGRPVCVRWLLGVPFPNVLIFQFGSAVEAVCSAPLGRDSAMLITAVPFI